MICDICFSPETKWYYQNKSNKFYVCKETHCYLQLQHNLGNDKNTEGWSMIQNEHLKCKQFISPILPKPLHIFPEDLTELIKLHYLTTKVFDSYLIQLRQSKFLENQDKIQIFGCFESLALIKGSSNFQCDTFPQLYFIANSQQPELMNIVIFSGQGESFLQIWYWHKELEQNDEFFDISTFLKKEEELQKIQMQANLLAERMNFKINRQENKFLICSSQPLQLVASYLQMEQSLVSLINKIKDLTVLSPISQEVLLNLESEIGNNLREIQI